MKILIDIGHPAHVHYFKNFTKEYIKRGNEVFFIVRNKESTVELISKLDFDYKGRGKGGSNVLTKILMLPYINLHVLKITLNFKPDLFLSFASPYAAQVSALLRIPHITFDDTEHAVWAHKLYRPFSDIILSPSCYMGNISKNQFLFDSYMELCHLHPAYFTPNDNVLNKLNILPGEKYIVVRFVSWNANHDVGQKGFTVEEKIQLVKKLSGNFKVFISSEGTLPPEIEQYRVKIDPSDFHDLLSFASLYVGEGSTTAAESAVLGTPAIYVNSLKVGYCTELEKIYGLLFQLQTLENVLPQAFDILKDPDSSKSFEAKRQKMLAEKIDPTEFMISFIENWPESKSSMIDKSVIGS